MARLHIKRDTVMNQSDTPGPSDSASPVQQLPLSSLKPPDQALPILAPGETDGLIPYPWKLVSVLDGGRSLVIVVQARSAVIRGATVGETPGQVRLTLYGTPHPSGPVTAISVHSIFLIRLLNPLESRHLSGS
jgi:hypothetical protein